MWKFIELVPCVIFISFHCIAFYYDLWCWWVLECKGRHWLTGLSLRVSAPQLSVIFVTAGLFSAASRQLRPWQQSLAPAEKGRLEIISSLNLICTSVCRFEQSVQTLGSLVCHNSSHQEDQTPSVKPTSHLATFRHLLTCTMREIVHVQAGQCGNQIGAKFWEIIR